MAAYVAHVFLAAPLPIAGDWLILRYTENTGIAFGIHLPFPWQQLLILLALVTVAVVALRSRTQWSRIGYGLILGGALANIIDRFLHGFVTDYIAVGTFPIFNVPDSCITVGIGLLLVESVIMTRNRQHRT